MPATVFRTMSKGRLLKSLEREERVVVLGDDTMPTACEVGLTGVEIALDAHFHHFHP